MRVQFFFSCALKSTIRELDEEMSLLNKEMSLLDECIWQYEARLEKERKQVHANSATRCK